MSASFDSGSERTQKETNVSSERRVLEGHTRPCEECAAVDWSLDTTRGEVTCNSCGLVVELIFLPFISSAFVPTDTMPKIVRAFAENQPVTSIVDAIRALLYEGSVGSGIWVALAWCVGIMLISYFFAVKEFKRQLG